jgi:catechol 2,3-dioxygenase-like lactoylglutathione lyase family enzyme
MAGTPQVAARLRAALTARDRSAFAVLLAENVRWGGPQDTPETCHTRTDVLRRLDAQTAAGLRADLIEVVPGEDALLVVLDVSRPARDGHARGTTVYQVMRLHDGLIVDIRGCDSRAAAAIAAHVADPQAEVPAAHQLVPILNVSDLAASFAWFGKLGWARHWDWSAQSGRRTFAAIRSGDCEIFLCLNGQGERGTWLSVWIDDADAVYQICLRDGIEVLRPPRDEPWGVRELHVRHPDGHVLRLTQSRHAH